MAGAVQEKSHGLKFAEQQLLRHGWEHGKGLGRAENGISEAIKVKVKCDKGGVGHKEGEQFTFHWWDHVFNKASSSLQVESDQNGIKLKKTVEDEEDRMISNKKPRKATLARDKLYGCFVKSATLRSGQEQPEPKVSDSDDSSSSDAEDEQRLDLSSTTKLSDAELMKACGGRTAHKGARHGLTMSAKLARLEQQEAEFMAKYSKKGQTGPSSEGRNKPPTSKSVDQRVELQEDTAEDTQSMKRKKKSSPLNALKLHSCEVSESPEADVQPKNKKKKKKKKAGDNAEETTDEVPLKDLICVENSDRTKRKQKKRKNDMEQNEGEGRTSSAAESMEDMAELQAVSKVKKKKKSSAKAHNEEEESRHTESSQSEPLQLGAPKTKKRKVLAEEAEVPEDESTVRQKRTKCKTDKQSIDNDVNEETLPPKKKEKKKKKSREETNRTS